jgi:hypothetical protein
LQFFNHRIFKRDFLFKAEDEDLPEVDTLRILKTNGPEWPYILLGALASVVMGASMPVYAILFGEVCLANKKSI